MHTLYNYYISYIEWMILPPHMPDYIKDYEKYTANQYWRFVQFMNIFFNFWKITKLQLIEIIILIVRHIL